MSDSTVFHTVIWTESVSGIQFSLGLESAIATKADAERLAEAMRAKFLIRYTEKGEFANAFRTRVGILEMPKPDAQLGHPAPRSSVEIDEIIDGLLRGPHVPGHSTV